MRRAVIDVGTNSIKLLVAEVAGDAVEPVLEESRQTRLGQGFYKAYRLQPEAVARTVEAVTEFAAKAKAQEAASIKVIGTSAAREALNSLELVQAIQRASGLNLEIISGEQEADWAFRGVTTDPALATEPLLLLDVGGGSTEFILGQGAQRQFASSYPLGTVRLLEQVPHGDPPQPAELAACRQRVREFLRSQVRPELGAFLEHQRAISVQVECVGTGGTASFLGCMEARLDHFDRVRLEATRLDTARLQWHTEHLWSLGLEERKRIVGLPPNRADVILTGVAIYEAVLSEFAFSELRLSTRGLRFAAILADH